MSETNDSHTIVSSREDDDDATGIRSSTPSTPSPPLQPPTTPTMMMTTTTPKGDTTGSSDTDSFILGRTRICDSAGYRGTVMYVGPVLAGTNASSASTSAPKIYAGIVWDDPTRGKHNGTILDPNTNQLVTYFQIPLSYYDTISPTTSYSNSSSRSTYWTSTSTRVTSTATCASFVPIPKIHRGIALTKEVLLSKYVPLDSTECVAPNTILPNCTVQCAAPTSASASASRRSNTFTKRQSPSTDISTTTSSTATHTATRYKPIQLIGEFNIRRHQQLELLCSPNVHSPHEPHLILRQLHTISVRSYQLSSVNVTDLLRWTTTVSSSSSDDNRPAPKQQQQQQQQQHQQQQQLVTHAIYEIDVAGNLFGPGWSSVHDIMAAFPNVTKLSFASNFLYDYTPPPSSMTTPTMYPRSSLQHLNLNGTKLQHLHSIYQIGHAFPHLQELIIANNQWDHGHHGNDVTDTTFTFANTTHATAPLLDHVLQIATTLSVLLRNLVLLDCSNCHLNFWSVQQQDTVASTIIDTVDKSNQSTDFDIINETNDDDSSNTYNLFLLLWSKLPKLQKLSWDDQLRFTKFIYPYRTRTEQHDEQVYFPSLQQLQCVHTGITDWMDIVPVWDEYIPTLRAVRFKHCPLVRGMSVAHIRQQLIGHCPQLNMINATPITDQERREVAKQAIAMSNNNNTRLTSDTEELPSHHRKYDYWVAKYPDIASSIMEQCHRDRSPTSTLGITAPNHLPFYTTNFAIVNVTFRSMASSSCTKEPFTRRLPTQMTIRKVKALCARQFDTEIDDQILYFRHTSTTDDNSIPQIMDCNDHTLHYYGVPDGAEIVMHEVNENRSRNERRTANGVDVNAPGSTDDIVDDPQRQRQELDQRVDRLEKEMNDFKLRQLRITKK